MAYKKPPESTNEVTIPESKTINDPTVIPVLFHEKKQMILNLLLENELNIMELKHQTNMNPGTIKRHLDDLVSKELAFISQKVKNKYGIVLKYYRATAKSFIIHIEWPG